MSAYEENLQDSPWANIPIEDTKLGQIILKKLHEKQQKSNTLFFLGVLARLGDERYRPSPNDKITNPMNSLKAKESGLVVSYTTVAEKRALYNNALDNNAVAYTGFKETIPLGAPGAEFNNVEFISGLWRVQKKFPYNITKVRDKEFVLVKKLPRIEKNKFEYYSASTVVWGGTGCSSNVNNPDWIVAKYETPRGTYWAYGQTIEQARAFLGIELYDKHQDLIHENLCAAPRKQK